MGIRFIVVVFAVLGYGLATAREVNSRNIPCKTPQNANSCYWTHGRLGMYNGTPAYRLWKTGTNRLLGIYSGPSVDRWGLDNEAPEFPASVQRSFDAGGWNRIYADFEICPLEKEKPGVMQAACIESAKNLVVNER
jgi:hypothetical protein